MLRMSDCPPKFLVKSTGGTFKKKDPTCPAEFVFENWIEGAQVVYVGKASGMRPSQLINSHEP